jgi:hypothetical protein
VAIDRLWRPVFTQLSYGRKKLIAYRMPCDIGRPFSPILGRDHNAARVSTRRSS